MGADPRLLDGALLSNFAPRSEVPLASNLLQGAAYSGQLMRNIHRVDVQEWRGNHYVQLFGTRAMLYRNEEEKPQLRAFDRLDAAAVRLGDRLAAGRYQGGVEQK